MLKSLFTPQLLWIRTMRKMKKSMSPGFTLVELMIVVVIIGILASIAIPKFGSVIARAKLSELKQALWQIIHIEEAFYYANSRYVGFEYGEAASELGSEQPDASHFTYSFVVADETAYGMENGTDHDINFDDDGNDGLSVDVNGVEDVISGSSGLDFTW